MVMQFKLYFFEPIFRDGAIVRSPMGRNFQLVYEIVLRWAGHAVRIEEDRSVFKSLANNSTGKRPLKRPRRRWEDN